ncbi:MAG: hypothetical protein IJ461_05780 [Clostridia bacterium]|nr:hypothetical protein [Clostridia bacterium]
MVRDHPKDCRCSRCRPCAPPKVLLPRVLGTGREWLRRWGTCLEVTGIDPCAQGPFTLVSVCLGTPQIRGGESCCHVLLPLECQVRDRKGCLHTASACLTLDVGVRLNCKWEECWRHQWVALPCLRLICPPPCSETLCFEVTLEIMIEVYLIKWEACSLGAPPKMACPDLPLYPPPCQWEKR